MVRTTCESYFYFMEKAFFFLCLCVKGYVQGGLRSGQDCPLTQKVRTQAESSKPVSVHIHLTHDDSEFLNSGETWTFFSSVIITFSLVRKVPSLRLGLGVTPSRITQDTTMPKLVAPQSRRKSECTVNIYSFCGFRPTDAVFTPSVIYLKYRVDTQKFLRISLMWG